MLNYVELIGKCINVEPNSIKLLMRSGEIFDVFLQDQIDINVIELNSFTRVIGRIAYINDIPFPNVVAEKVYQLKDTMDYTN